MFDFVLFAFYTLICSHHICCFFVHSIAKLFAQPSIFDVPEFSLIFTLKQPKNITSPKHQATMTSQTSKPIATYHFHVRINNQPRYQKTKNSKFFASHPSVFHMLKLFPYLILPESCKQKTPHTTESFNFRDASLNKITQQNHQNPPLHTKISTKHQNHTHITIFHLQNTTFLIFQATLKVF